jgi:hypothetical protein
MPMPPLPPMGGDEMMSPMSSTSPPPSPGVGGGDLASLLGVGGAPPQMGMMDPIQQGMMQFDMLRQMVMDLTRTFPGSEQAAAGVMDALDLWQQQALVTITPPSSGMPGADQML